MTDQPAELRRDERLRVVTLGSLVALAVTLFIVLLVSRAAEPNLSRLGLLLVAFALVERFPVHLETERGVFTWTAYEIPLTFALFFALPIESILGCTIGTTLIRLTRRMPTSKLAFNMAMTSIHCLAAVFAFQFFERVANPDDLFRLVGCLVILEVLAALNTQMVVSVITFTGGSVDAAARRSALVGSVTALLIAVSLANVGVVVALARPYALVFVLAIAIASYLGLKRFTTATQRILGLKMLHDFGERLNSTSLAEDPMKAILDHVRSVLRANYADLVLLRDDVPSEGVRPPRLLCPGHPLFERVVQSRQGIRVVRQNSLVEADEILLDELGVKDVMAVPLVRDDQVVAVLVVADRKNDTSTFCEADLSLFETMASHATMTLENSDLVDRLRDEALLREHESLHDSLTGLPNRVLFARKADEMIQSCDGGVCVLLIDLNRFKEINDTLGHHVGDEMLRALATRFRAVVEPNGVLARLGGDEFAIVMPGLENRETATAFGERLVRVAESPFDAEGVSLAIDLAIGIAQSPVHGTDRATLLRSADVAMYAAKEFRRSAWAFYEPEQQRTTARHLALIGDLRTALQNGQIDVHYQPRIELATNRVTSFEALARWFHPVHGTVSPDEFVPLAERSGLIFELTDVVMRRAFQDCATWRAAGIEASIGVNLSGRASLDRNFTELLHRRLAEARLSADSVTLEVTEHELMNDAGSTAVMLSALRESGVTVAIDDFGTGHSSLAYLTALPVDELKIDKSFVFGVLENAVQQTILRTIASLGANLGLDVVAEGVEDAETAEFLTALGCRFAQGYHYAKPMPARDIESWMREFTRSTGPGTESLVFART